MINPVVSVVMITYGHESYIKEAVNSVLMQECDFQFELIIANDKSPDGTDAIIRDILNDHPRSHCIRYFHHNKNMGLVSNFNFALKKATGKYIALCEGDDYWIDSLKLKKQVDFLEANSKLGMAHSAYFLRNDNEKTFRLMRSSFNHQDRNLPWGIIGQELIICTSSVLFRTDLHRRFTNQYQKDFSLVPIADTQTWFHFARLSGIGYINQPLSVYRKSASGVTGSVNTKARIRFLENALKLDLYLADTYNAPEIWREKIKYKFSRSILIEALLDGDSYRIKKYGTEIFQKKHLLLGLLQQLILLPFAKRQLINRFLVIFKK